MDGAGSNRTVQSSAPPIGASIDPLKAAPGPGEAGAASVQASDLAELIAGFNEVSQKLEATHQTLRSEVKRLNSELRAANEELQRSKRLAALGEMAAGIAHEVRNPLGSIRLYSSMLEDDLSGMPEQCEIAVKIGSAVVRLNEVVGDVLAFAREIRVRPSWLDSDDLGERVLHACGVLDTGASSIEAKPECSRVWADRGLLEQALINVVRNGLEASESAGRAGVRIEFDERVDQESGRPACVVRVSDFGPGVPPEVVERMFNPFFTTRETGTGLGLAIVHRIVDAHGGRVEVRSGRSGDVNEDIGAIVELWMPEPLNGRAIESELGTSGEWQGEVVVTSSGMDAGEVERMR